jgi:hypothetical protein
MKNLNFSVPVNNEFSINASFEMEYFSQVPSNRYIIMAIKIEVLSYLLLYLGLPTNMHLQYVGLSYTSNKGTLNSIVQPGGTFSVGQDYYVNYNNDIGNEDLWEGTVTLTLRAVP